MVRIVGAAAAGLGHLVRFIVILLAALWRGLPGALIVLGVALIDHRAALITAGLLLYFEYRPDRRES